MSQPNLFIAYVTDMDRAVAFYSDLFDMQPIVRTPRYVPFDLGVQAHHLRAVERLRRRGCFQPRPHQVNRRCSSPHRFQRG
jgi:catechol 2,3-dioxygenase-like lactoylglutathione lyase family enzyme